MIDNFLTCGMEKLPGKQNHLCMDTGMLMLTRPPGDPDGGRQEETLHKMKYVG